MAGVHNPYHGLHSGHSLIRNSHTYGSSGANYDFVLFYSDVLVRRGTPRARRNTFFAIMSIYAIGLVLSGLSLQLKIPVLVFAFFILVAIGIYLSVPAFWNLVQRSFSDEVGVFVIGVANGVGNLVQLWEYPSRDSH